MDLVAPPQTSDPEDQHQDPDQRQHEQHTQRAQQQLLLQPLLAISGIPPLSTTGAAAPQPVEKITGDCAAQRTETFAWSQSTASASSDRNPCTETAVDRASDDGNEDGGLRVAPLPAPSPTPPYEAAIPSPGGQQPSHALRASPTLQVALDDSRIEQLAHLDQPSPPPQQQQQQSQFCIAEDDDWQIERTKEETLFAQLDTALKALPRTDAGDVAVLRAQSPELEVVSPSNGIYCVNVVVPGVLSDDDAGDDGDSDGDDAALVAAAASLVLLTQTQTQGGAAPPQIPRQGAPTPPVTGPESGGGINLSIEDSLARIQNGGAPFVYAAGGPPNGTIDPADAPNSATLRAENRRSNICEAPSTATKRVAEATAAIASPAAPPPTPAADAARPDPTKSRRINDIASIGHYQVGAKIGDGSFSVVKQGKHLITGERVALKLVDKSAIKMVENKYLVKNLHREEEILRSLNHKNIIQLLEIIETADVLCLVLTLATVDMYEHLGVVRKLTEKKTLKYSRQLLSAITYLHKHNVVHRDIKAENLMLDSDGDLKLIDFGLSNVFADAAGSLSTNCGSLAYSAPELLTCKTYGTEVDVWSMGVCIYAMATGVLPFGNIGSITQLHARMLNQDYTLPSTLSDELKDLFAKIFVAQKERITVAALWQHPWFTGAAASASAATAGGLNAAERNAAGGTDLTDENVDVTLVDQIVRMGYGTTTKAAVIQSIVDQRCDASCATYHLMASKHRRTITQRKRAEHSRKTGPNASTSGSKYANKKVNGVLSSSSGRETMSMSRPRVRDARKPSLRDLATSPAPSP